MSSGPDPFNEIFEIDRCLRTGKFDTQVATLKRLPPLIAALSSDPVNLGTLLLRLTDFFVSTNNELRTWVTRSLKSCGARPLSQDLPGHGEEIVRRLGVVWDSNDVYARSLVVQIYGCLAAGIATCAGAIYRIRQSLLAPHEEEYEAATMATLALLHVRSSCLSHLADALLWLRHRLDPQSFLHPPLLEALGQDPRCAHTNLLIYQHLVAELEANANVQRDAPPVLAILASICHRTGFHHPQHQALLERFGGRAV